MVQYTYNINGIPQSNISSVEHLLQQDANLINQYQINNLFKQDKHYIELHIADLAGTPLTEDLVYGHYKILGDSGAAGKEGASVLYINVLEDIKTYGYETGDIQLTYHLLNDVFSTSTEKSMFFIQEISTDRLELKLNTTTLTEESLKAFVNNIKSSNSSVDYLDNYRLNFQDNTFPLVLNIDTFTEDTGTSVIVKLYQPLSPKYTEKSILNIVEIVADSVSYEITTSVTQEELPQNYISPANFNLAVTDEQVVPTEYLSYNSLLSFPVDNTNSKLYSSVAEKSVELSIDYADYSQFINFSSLYERLSNFEYKLTLINQYSSSISILDNTQQSTQQVTGSRSYYEDLIKGLLSNFDHYERHLYYSSGSTAWPKSNAVAPYINKPTTDPESVTWFTQALQNATLYDASNYNNLTNTIPSYLQEDPNNENYLLFINMIGQHFDNLWIYAEHLTDKYDADNRLDFGVSKDLVKDVLVNFGINIYTSKKSIEDLFNSLITQTASNEGEIINHYITGSVRDTNIPVAKTSYDDYQKEVYKRIYHNLPLLLKSKGTERGLRALINCFGIPSDVLKVKLYGGLKVDGDSILSDAVYVTSSLQKIRLDNEGVTLPEDTLSSLVRTHKPGKDYTDDLHVIEVGFSPTDDVNTFIESELPSNFDLDDYLGDPRNLYNNSYQLLDASGNNITSLQEYSEAILNNLSTYNVKDYVRLLKFFDNAIFKMIKDFVPARATVNTGIIIKPHILDRSKIKFTQADVTFHHYSASIETSYTTGSHGYTFGGRDQYITDYTEYLQTPLGLAAKEYHTHSVAQFDGEFSQSFIDITDGEINKNNLIKYNTYSSTSSLVTLIETFPTGVFCNVNTLNRIVYVRSKSTDGRIRNLISDFSVGIGNDNVKYYEVTGETPTTPNIYITNYEYNIAGGYATYKLHVENSAFIGYFNILGERSTTTKAASLDFTIQNDIYGPFHVTIPGNQSSVRVSYLVNIPVGVYDCFSEANGAPTQAGATIDTQGFISYGYSNVYEEGVAFSAVEYSDTTQSGEVSIP